MTSARAKAIELRIKQWPLVRRRSLVRYSLKLGVVGFGGIMFLVSSTQLYLDGRATPMLVLLMLIMCLVGGAIWGLCMCLFFELRYRIWCRRNEA